MHIVAAKLRKIECERARGNLALLEQVEQTPDASLLQKWGWITTICLSLLSFFGMPLFIGVVQSFLPAALASLVWTVTKGLMGMSLLMFAFSIYFTIGFKSD